MRGLPSSVICDFEDIDQKNHLDLLVAMLFALDGMWAPY